MNKRKDKENASSVYLNRPIQSKEEDRIGILTYVERLNDAIESGAKIVAVTSDFGTGKSSLISLYRKMYASNKKNKKKLIDINMWGFYSQLDGKETSELHKTFVYQVISQINYNKNRKSKYISRKLSKDFGILTLNGQSIIWSVMTMIFLMGLFLSSIVYKFQSYVEKIFSWEKGFLNVPVAIMFIISIIGLGIVIANSEIIFSSKKSEGNREFDENILIDLFKREVMNHIGREHYIIVIEDLDRIESKESVLQFLREFRKYYLTNGGKHNISFIVCIKPEALLQTENDKNKLHEYKKIFDYTINLQKINIDNYDAVLNGLLQEKKQWLTKLHLDPNIDTQGMEWMIYGKNIDIREVKNRLNESLTLYESLCNRFPINGKKSVITFEKCAVATYMRREYEEDFYKLDDEDLDVFISLYAIRGIEDMEKEQEPENWTTLNPAFKDELIRLVKSKLVDANYRLYFYNYPSNSRLFSVSEMRVYNSIVYQEAPKNRDEYEEYLKQTEENVIIEAYKKINSLGVIMPLFLLDYDKLFVILYRNYENKFFELIIKQRFDINNEARICDLIEKCIVKREGQYEWDILIQKLSQHLDDVVDDKTLLLSIRKRMCKKIPNKIRQFKILFMGTNPFITLDETEASNDIDAIFDVINYDMMDSDTDSLVDIHRLMLTKEEWKREYIEFYQKVIESQEIDIWKDFIAQACSHFESIPDGIVEIYENKINTKEIAVDEYVKCIENVNNLEKAALEVLSNNLWVKGLSYRLCNLMYQFGFCLEYICNSALLENRNICYDEENIFNCIASNCEWILNQAPVAFEAIRKDILVNSNLIKKYSYIFENPYSIISQEEIGLVSDVQDVLILLEDRSLSKNEIVYIANYFNSKYRNQTTSFYIMQYILNQKAEIAKELFYSLDLSKFSYARMSNVHRKTVIDKAYEVFNMDSDPSERVNYLHFTGVPVEIIEKDLYKELNNDNELCKLYIEYVNKLNKIHGYTFKNIVNLKSTYIYSEIINQKLWENGYYDSYVSSKTALEKKFSIEDDKVKDLWPVYVKIFNSASRKRTREYMKQNSMFMKRLIDAKGYETVEDNIIFYATGKQTGDLLKYVDENYDDNTKVEYFRSISGFDNYDAAHLFCELAKKNRIIGMDDTIYHNVKGKLINSGLEGWLTRIWKKTNNER